MQIRFKSFGPLKRAIGESMLELDIEENGTVRDVIEAVLELSGSEIRRLILHNDSISGNLIVMLNMTDVKRLDGLDTQVSDGDEIAVLPHVQGG